MSKGKKKELAVQIEIKVREQCFALEFKQNL